MNDRVARQRVGDVDELRDVRREVAANTFARTH